MQGNLVYVVTRYQSIIGVYEKFDDASQVAQSFIAKGSVCDICCQIIK